MSFRPGAAFFEDYERFYRRRHQTELQWEFNEDRRKISEPLKIAYLFTEKRTGRSIDATGFVGTKEVETAKLLLATLNYDEMPSFFDFALAEARKTSFDVQTLGGIKQYLPAYLAFRERRALNKAQEDAWKLREQEGARRLAYDQFRRKEARRLFDSLPDQEKAIIDNLVETYVARFGGGVRNTMADVGRARFMVERYGEQLKTFEQWENETTSAPCGL